MISIKRGAALVNASCHKQPLLFGRRNTVSAAVQQEPSNATNVQTNLHHPAAVESFNNDPLLRPHLRDAYSKYVSRETYAAALAPMEDALALFPEVYTDTAFATLENEKVFKRAWIALDHPSASLLNHGDVLSTTVGDIPVLIANHEGQLKGFYNVCRHRGSILLKEGKYNKCNVIRCPYHSWGYRTDGKLAGAPYFNDDRVPSNKTQRKDKATKNELQAFTKINFNKKNFGLLEFGVRQLMGTLFVNLDADESRRDALWQHQMGDLEENYAHYPYADMRTVVQLEYEIQANYKMVQENFMEYYHLPWVHPELCEVSSVANHVRRQGYGQYTAFATYPLSYGGTPMDPDSFAPFEGLNEVDLEAGWFVTIFPNICYFIFPHHVASLITAPTEDPKVTREKMSIMMHKDVKAELDTGNVELEAKIKRLTDFYVLVNGQDIAAVERVQKGIRGGAYRGGPLSGKFEEPIRRYQHILIDYMTDQHMREYPGDADFAKSETLKARVARRQGDGL